MFSLVHVALAFTGSYCHYDGASISLQPVRDTFFSVLVLRQHDTTSITDVVISFDGAFSSAQCAQNMHLIPGRGYFGCGNFDMAYVVDGIVAEVELGDATLDCAGSYIESNETMTIYNELLR